MRKVGHYVPRPIVDYNLPVPVLSYYARLNTHHFYLFLNFIRKKLHLSQNRIRVSLTPQISSQNKIYILQFLLMLLAFTWLIPVHPSVS